MNVIVSPIRVRVALTLARYTIVWSGKNLEHQLQKTKVWEDNEIRTQIRIQDVDHIYDGC